jgi:hypothetical protein
MYYQTFKEWALKQNWLEIDKGFFLLPIGKYIRVSVDESDRLCDIEDDKAELWTNESSLQAFACPECCKGLGLEG